MNEKHLKLHVKNSPYKILWWKIALIFVVSISIVSLLYFYSPYATDISLKDSIIGLFVGITVFVVNFMFSRLKRVFRKRKTVVNNSSKKISFFLILDSLFSSLFVKIGIIIIVSSMEEYIFRSYILSFTNAHFSVILSISINAIIFFFFHFNSKVFELIFMGMAFAAITLYTDNMFTAIVAHASNNLLVYFIRRNFMMRKLKLTNTNIK